VRAPADDDARQPVRCDLDAPDLVGQAVLAVLGNGSLQLLFADGASGQLNEVDQLGDVPGQAYLTARGNLVAAAAPMMCGEDCQSSDLALVDTSGQVVWKDQERFMAPTHLGGSEEGLFLFSLQGTQLVVDARNGAGAVTATSYPGQSFEVVSDPGPDGIVLVDVATNTSADYHWWNALSGGQPPVPACYLALGPSGGAVPLGQGIVYAHGGDDSAAVIHERAGQFCAIDVPGSWTTGTFPYLVPFSNRQGWVMLYWDYAQSPDMLQLLPANVATGEHRGPYAPVPPSGSSINTDLPGSPPLVDADGQAVFVIQTGNLWQLARIDGGQSWELLGQSTPVSPTFGLSIQTAEASGSYVAWGYQPVAGGESVLAEALHPATQVDVSGLSATPAPQLSRDGRCLATYQPMGQGSVAQLVLLDMLTGKQHPTAVTANPEAPPAITFLPGDSAR
jgi:hypothetical protein